jgi:diguanylate cyclase (GGDEF)-like protein
VNRLFARQRAKATLPSGEVDIDALGELVTEAYEQAERDLRRTDRSIALMAEELDELNRGLENLVQLRTAALRDREADSNAQNLLFDAALNNMSHGLLMYDDDARLVIYNRRFLELYGLTDEAIKRGMTLQAQLEVRLANNTFDGDPAEFATWLIAKIKAGETVDRMTDLPDGRTVSIINRPMDGGGWVVTHEDISERRRAERRIAHMAHHDALTDLPNRLLLRERLADAIAALGTGNRLAVFYLDLDNFKAVNDTLGHQYGDALLKTVADRLLACVDENVTVARVGGDEFAIILSDLTQLADAAMVAQAICEAIRAPCDLSGHAVPIDTSIGIAIGPDDGADPDELLKNADLALYRAKAEGRGTYRFFEPEMDAMVQARRTLECELRLALAEGQFILHYQPIMDLGDNVISCCEALVRWQHPERGLVPPFEFISVAEEIGLIVPLGEWVLRKACADAALWPGDCKVAVNLSPIQMAHANLLPMVISALASSGLPANRLELEITESVMMQNTEATLAALHQLRALGVRISMDDFGTGYSALSYLRQFPFDKLKIDRSFISDLARHDDALAIVQAVTSMAKSLRMVTTAEGVETIEQLDQVRMLGCTQVQGFFISRPQPVETMVRVLQQLAPRKAKSA